MSKSIRHYGAVDTKVAKRRYFEIDFQWFDKNLVSGYWIWATMAVVLFLAVAFFFFETGSSFTLAALNLPAHASLNKNAHASEQLPGARQVAIEVEIDLLSFAVVRQYLQDQGVDWMTDDETELYKYVPRKMVMNLDPSLVQQNIGEAALDGFVVFNIASYDRPAAFYHCSWTIVVDLFGNIQRVTPGALKNGKAAWIAGLKMKSPEKILMSEVMSEVDEDGPVALYEWTTDVLEYVANSSWGCSNSAHDARYGYDNSNIIWRPCKDYLIGENSETGNLIEAIYPDGLHDINHLQVLEGSEMILSAREDNQFAKLRWDENKILWRVGGTNGTYDVYSDYGHHYPAGENFIYGQHNVEYYGEGEYYMFDNQFAAHDGQYMSDHSRLLAVTVDDTLGYATITWEYDIGFQSPVFGDCDRLPSGNVLATAWPRNTTKDISYDARIMEVTKANEIAWDLQIFGTECSEQVCDRSPKGTPGDGWVIYSAERFYSSAVIANATCTTVTGHHEADTYQELLFTAYCPIKTVYPSNATFFVHDSSGSQIAKGAFSFSPHWRVTKTSVKIEDGYCDDATLTIKDEWGNSVDTSVS